MPADASVISISTLEGRDHTQLRKINSFVMKICGFNPHICTLPAALSSVCGHHWFSLYPAFHFFSSCFEMFAALIFYAHIFISQPCHSLGPQQCSSLSPLGSGSVGGLSCCCQAARCPLIKVSSSPASPATSSASPSFCCPNQNSNSLF